VAVHPQPARRFVGAFGEWRSDKRVQDIRLENLSDRHIDIDVHPVGVEGGFGLAGAIVRQQQQNGEDVRRRFVSIIFKRRSAPDVGDARQRRPAFTKELLSLCIGMGYGITP
jgi:hypothetical protein